MMRKVSLSLMISFSLLIGSIQAFELKNILTQTVFNEDDASIALLITSMAFMGGSIYYGYKSLYVQANKMVAYAKNAKKNKNNANTANISGLSPEQTQKLKKMEIKFVSQYCTVMFLYFTSISFLHISTPNPVYYK